ncbi:taste receptor type 2 member 140-like [Dendropsophus ebraccatus]|uniref:taste receptor type 2 member 140-like n=1 Tax=Dendropsophus ebraccatus TaxID=150705 RepID=UPI00383228B2
MCPDSTVDQNIPETAEMFTALELSKLVTGFLMLAPGTALNFIIIAIYYGDWRRRQRLSPCDQIFLSIALINLAQQGFATHSIFMNIIFSNVLNLRLWLLYVYTIFLTLSYFHFWNTSWLSIYYCLKLVNCSGRHFTWMRSRLSSSMAEILGVTLVVVFLITLPFPWMVEIIPDHNMTRIVTGDLLNTRSPYVTVNLLLGCIFPFFETLICIGLSVTSLLRHVRRMKKSRSEFSSGPQVSGHIRAVRVMTLQAFLNASLQLSASGLILTSLNPGVILDGIFTLILVINPSAEALTLITGNPKLKSRLLRILNIF